MNLDGYVEVKDRLTMALNTFPDLRVVEGDYSVEDIGGQIFLVCEVSVYRTPDDPLPTKGRASEPVPGQTNFTRNSEMMVGYTSALGRALGYMGYGIAKGIASINEIIARTEDPDEIVTRTKAVPGSRARKPSQTAPEASQSDFADPEDHPATRSEPSPGGRRETPTEKMFAFLERLNIERGNPLGPDDINACAGSFDLCREKIDELQALPKA